MDGKQRQSVYGSTAVPNEKTWPASSGTNVTGTNTPSGTIHAAEMGGLPPAPPSSHAPRGRDSVAPEKTSGLHEMPSVDVHAASFVVVGLAVPALAVSALVVGVLVTLIGAEQLAAARRRGRGEPSPLERLDANAMNT